MATSPRSMTTHTLDGLKGWPRPHAVDYVAKLSTNVTLDPVPAGRVVHLNASGDFELGLNPGSTKAGVAQAEMAMFLIQDSDSFEVANYGGDPATEAGVWTAAFPAGYLTALVAIGAYELESTEFVSDTYARNDCLTGYDSNSAANGGKLAKAYPYTNPVCGVVSRGTYTNCHGRSVIAFWPVWLPQYEA